MLKHGAAEMVDRALRAAILVAVCWVGYELHELRREAPNTYTLEQGVDTIGEVVERMSDAREFTTAPIDPYPSP